MTQRPLWHICPVGQSALVRQGAGPEPHLPLEQDSPTGQSVSLRQAPGVHLPLMHCCPLGQLAWVAQSRPELEQ